MKVVIAGGGYAGLTCAIQLRKTLVEAEVHLLDPQPSHLKNNHLHLTLRQPREKFSLPFDALAQRFGFRFHRTAPNFTRPDLPSWQERRTLPLPKGELSFDKLVIATGAKTLPLPGGDFTYDLEDFRNHEGMELLEAFFDRIEDHPAQATVVGAGASGIQFLFALHDLLQKRRIVNRMRLVCLEPRTVPSLPSGIHEYILKRIKAAGMEFLPATRYLGQQGSQLHLENLETGKEFQTTSDLTLLLPGVAAHPQVFDANSFGQISHEGQLLPDIFTAGDCSHFAAPGLNAQTAQAAVRKGKQVAANIAQLALKQPQQPYAYRERGYFIAMGPFDGVGWLGLKRNIVTGLAAMAIKELLEAQHDLLTEGTAARKQEE